MKIPSARVITNVQKIVTGLSTVCFTNYLFYKYLNKIALFFQKVMFQGSSIFHLTTTKKSALILWQFDESKYHNINAEFLSLFLLSNLFISCVFNNNYLQIISRLRILEEP